MNEIAYNNNIAVLADTLRIDIGMNPARKTLTGTGVARLQLGPYTLDCPCKITRGFRFKNDNAGVVLFLEGWECGIFAYTEGDYVFVVLLGPKSMIDDYSKHNGVSLDNISGIMGACKRQKLSDIWNPIIKENQQ